MNSLKILQSIGLTENEAKLYLANLQLGPATAIQLSKKVGLSRQVIYTLATSLITKGLMKEVIVGHKRYFQAIGPEALDDRIKTISQEIAGLIPQLKEKQSKNLALPTVAIYDTPISMREGYRRFMEEAVDGDNVLTWATNRVWYDSDPEFLHDFLLFKKNKKIRDLIIAPNTHAAKKEAKRQLAINPLAEYRFTDDYWPASAERWVWNDTIGMLTIHENATNLLIIESSQQAAIERYNFRNAWKSLRQVR